jgi:predicted MFS family arabinose efflux permease
LIGGFASTVCWPLSAFLAEAFGWRGACFAYAAMHLVIALPLQFVMPAGAARETSSSADAGSSPSAGQPLTNERVIFALNAAVMTIAAGIGAIVIVHMLTFLQARGIEFAAAVAIGTLFGPAQVGARFVERLFGRHYHPVWTMIAACVLMAVGLVMLHFGLIALALAIVLYGAGYGISWIARGTLPLALFGPARYPVLMGKLAFPSLIVQALAPSAGALLIERQGVDLTIATLIAFALINVALIAILWSLCPRTPEERA